MKFLLIVAAGKDAAYQKWNSCHLDYGFDMAILNYTQEEFEDTNSINARFVLNMQGMKWKLVSQFFSIRQEVIDEYDYFLIMDDDIETTPHEVQKFFDVCLTESFDLSQPGLGSGSTYTYPSTLKIQSAKYHLTSTVEIMAPCFSKRLLKDTLVDISCCDPGFGWGLEGVWISKFLRGAGQSVFGGKIGVIDCVDFYHLRPVGGHSSGIYEKFGSPVKELKYQEQKYGFFWNIEMLHTYSIEWKE